MGTLYKFDEMPRWLKVSVAVACLFCVIAICIAPDLDLPDTTNRALQAASIILLLLSALAIVVAEMVLCEKYSGSGRREELAWTALEALSPVRDITCVQRC